MYIVSYSLFADEDTGMYSHAAPQYNGRQKAKPFIVVLNMNKFSYSDSKQGATSNKFTCLTSFTFKNVEKSPFAYLYYDIYATRRRHSSCCTAINVIIMYWCSLSLLYWYRLFVYDSCAVSVLLSVNEIITYLLTIMSSAKITRSWVYSGRDTDKDDMINI